jgi:hypothetical protein
VLQLVRRRPSASIEDIEIDALSHLLLSQAPLRIVLVAPFGSTKVSVRFRGSNRTEGRHSFVLHFMTLFVRSHDSVARQAQTRTSEYSSGRATARYAVWPIVMSSFGIEVRRWIRKRVSRKIVTVNPDDTLGKRAIGFKKFLDGEPSAFKRNE